MSLYLGFQPRVSPKKSGDIIKEVRVRPRPSGARRQLYVRA
jgi:hypothetical protein